MKPTIPRKPVYIKWEDASCKSSWTDFETAKKCDTGIIETIAWLLEETKTHVRFSCAIDFTDQTIGDVWTIPRNAVKKMKHIKGI